MRRLALVAVVAALALAGCGGTQHHHGKTLTTQQRKLACEREYKNEIANGTDRTVDKLAGTKACQGLTIDQVQAIYDAVGRDYENSY